MSLELKVWREFTERVLQIRFENKDISHIKSNIDVEVELAKRVIDNRWKKNHVDKNTVEKYKICRACRIQMFENSLPPLYEAYKGDNSNVLLKDIVSNLTSTLQSLFDDVLANKCQCEIINCKGRE